MPLLLACTGIAVAQSTARPAVDPGSAIAGSCGVGMVDGQLVGGGASYEISFLSGAVEVTPALGERAPHDYPLLLTLDSVRRGDREVCTGGPESPIHAEGELRVEYRRGLHVVERYDVRADGVEQSFVLRERPAGRGDLVVRLAIRSELRAEPGSGLGGLELTTPGIGGVSIGAVTGIDADGVRAAGSLAYDGRHLELSLPDRFVEHATYPLVLDPLIGGITSAGASFDDYEPDIAYDATNDVYLVVWEFRTSATDYDVWGQRLNGDGTRQGGIVFAVRSSGIQSRPVVANVAVSDQFLVVWQDDRSGSSDIVGVRVAAIDGTTSGPVTIAGTAADEITPDAGSDATGPDDEALIVWKNASGGIEGVEVEVQAGGVPFVIGAVVQIDSATQSGHPKIAKSGGVANRYLVVWETRTATDWLVGYRAVDRDFRLLTPVYTLSGLGRPIVHPDVDGNGTEWMCVYQRMESPTSSLGDIYGFEVAYDSMGGLVLFPGGAIEAEVNDDELEPDVAFAGTTYVVTWSDQRATQPTEYGIIVTKMLPVTGRPCGVRYETGQTGQTRNSKPAICAMLNGGGAENHTLLCWEHGDLTNGNSLVMRQLFDAYGGGPVTTIAPGCAGGGTASTDGPFALGNARFQLRLGGADPLATVAALSFAQRSAVQIPCGSCSFLTPLATVTRGVSNGAAAFTLPLPCDTNLIGAALGAQWIVLAPSSTACPIAPGVAGSNILGMVLSD
ncbi:MAG: hypothetical protein IPM29_04925 [Planctomycetes bacterium]|nr:hypothetical protein [Planctomycetota bacterium]